jgi:hypothetical protein
VRIEVLPGARDDLVAGFRFYEQQAAGLGNYFRDSLFADIELWLFMAGFTRRHSDIIAL